MDLTRFMANRNEKPLDNIAINGGFTSIFRTIGCIGDSLASGELESFEMGKPNYYDYFEYSWGQFIARDAGCKVYNFSRGGMTAKEFIETYADEMGFFDIEKRCQAYIIALGVNDKKGVLDGKFEFGTVDDIDADNYALNRQTFAGWYGAIISKYKEIQPHAKFFLMTMPDVDDEKVCIEANEKHAELLYGIAKKISNCYVLDFHKYATFYNDETFKKTFYTGGHMNVMGYRMSATIIESYIDYIIRNNPEDFNQSGFIGKVHRYVK